MSMLERFSDEERKVPGCVACRATRRRSKELGGGPIYCFDCKSVMESFQVVTKPTIKKGVVFHEIQDHTYGHEPRPCKECGRDNSDRYRNCGNVNCKLYVQPVAADFNDSLFFESRLRVNNLRKRGA